MKILITGCAGFIGSHTAERFLKEQHDVIGIDCFDNFYNSSIKWLNVKPLFEYRDKFTFIHDRIENVNFGLLDFDVVIHLAAVPGVRNSIQNPIKTFDYNIMTTVNLLQSTKCEKFIFASSSSVYGNNKTPFSIDNNVDFPISQYAASKKAGELICHTYNHLYGLNVTCLRFFTVYGPRQRPDLAISKFIKSIYKEEEIQIYGDGQTSRDYTYVSDIVDGIVAAVDHCKGYSIFNLGNDAPVKLIDLVNKIAAVVGNKPKLKFISKQLGDVEATWADISHTKSALNYNPKIKLTEGLQKQFNWFKNCL